MAKELVELTPEIEQRLRKDMYWRYLGERSLSVHGFQQVVTFMALCGVAPSFLGSSSDWFGSGSQVEYDRVAGLPLCGNCLRMLGYKRS
jgi:hypothetical protein